MNVCSQVWFRRCVFLSRRKILRQKEQLFCENTNTKCMSPSFISWFNADKQCFFSATPHCFHEDTRWMQWSDHILLSTYTELLYFGISVLGGTYWNSFKVLGISLLSTVLVQFSSICCMVSRKPDPSESHRATGK